MPVKPENRALYPADWPRISARIRERGGDACEGCRAWNHAPHPVTGSMVVLTTAHLNHEPSDCRDENLASLCQRCHNRHDARHRAETRRQTLADRLADQQRDLFADEGMTCE